MRIEKKMTYYGYDLVINHILHKRCLNCQKWYEFDGEIGYCKRCISTIENVQMKFSQHQPQLNTQTAFNQQ